MEIRFDDYIQDEFSGELSLYFTESFKKERGNIMNHLSAGHKNICPLRNISCRLDKSCGPYEACHLHEACRLYKEIPRSMLDKLWADNNHMVDMDFTFLGFEDVYAAVTQFVPKNRTILDLGCAYGTSSFQSLILI